MRLNAIMRMPAARKPKRLWLYGALALALAPVTALQFAWAEAESPVSAPAHAAAKPMAQSPAVMAPVDAKISVPFGTRVDRKTGHINFHEGVDFAVPSGTPVRAPADGVVTSAKTKWGYGKVVEIDHGNGFKTRLAHLDAQRVAVGDHVKAGQTVAISGDSGILAGAGPHLHFEMWKNGKAIDPATVLAAKAG